MEWFFLVSHKYYLKYWINLFFSQNDWIISSIEALNFNDFHKLNIYWNILIQEFDKPSIFGDLYFIFGVYRVALIVICIVIIHFYNSYLFIQLILMIFGDFIELVINGINFNFLFVRTFCFWSLYFETLEVFIYLKFILNYNLIFFVINRSILSLAICPIQNFNFALSKYQLLSLPMIFMDFQTSCQIFMVSIIMLAMSGKIFHRLALFFALKKKESFRPLSHLFPEVPSYLCFKVSLLPLLIIFFSSYP
jgi:hypothetical protein